MLKKLKLKVLKLMLKYHDYMKNYYLDKIEDYNSSEVEHWLGKATPHISKGNGIYEEILSMKSILD